MEKRDPLRELGNTSDNNEPQESTKERKVPEITISDKENGVKMSENSDPEKDGCGKLRLSFLKAFDPLYSESPDKPKVKLQQDRIRPQLIIEDSDSDRSPSPIPIDVSDDDAFVDATYLATSDDDINIIPETPKTKHLVLEESLLKFYTPQKFDTTLVETAAHTTSEPLSKKSVLSEENKPTSTSVGNQPLEEVNLSDSEKLKLHSTVGDISENKEYLSAKENNTECQNRNTEHVEPELDIKEKDNSSASEENTGGNISDSTYSEVSEIKTDSPDKSKENSEIELGNEFSEEFSTERELKTRINLETEESTPTYTDISEIQTSDYTNKDTSDFALIKTSDTSGKKLENPEQVEENNVEKQKEDLETTSKDINNQDGVEKVPAASSDKDTVKYSETDEDFKTAEEKSSEYSDKSIELEKAETELNEKSQEPSKLIEDEISNEEFVQSVQKDVPEEKLDSGKETKLEELNKSFDTQTSVQSVEEESINKNLESEEDQSTEKCIREPNQETDEEATNSFETCKSVDEDKFATEGDITLTIPQNEEQSLNSEIETDKPVEEHSEDTIVSTHQGEEHLDSGAESHKSVDITSSPESTTDTIVTINQEEEQHLESEVDSRKSIDKSVESTIEDTTETVNQEERQQLKLEVDSRKSIDKSVESTIEDTTEIVNQEERQQLKSEVDSRKSIGESVESTTEGTTVTVRQEEQNLDSEVDSRKSIGERVESAAEDTTVTTHQEGDHNLDSAVDSRKSVGESAESTTEADTTGSINQDEEHHPDSGVESIEGSYSKSPKGSVDDLEADGSETKEDSILPEDELLGKPKVESDAPLTSDDDSKTISEGSVQDDQTLTEIKDQKAESSQSQVVPSEEVKNIPEDTTKTVSNNTAFDADFYKTKMADLSERLSEQQQENSDLKLQLNASQQAKASLELEIRQKEEIIIKTQAEALKNEQIYKQEIKQLREKLKENSKLIEKDGSKELEEQLKEAKAREAKAIAELNQRNKDDLNYQKIMEEYENTIATRFSDYQKLKEEHETATRHLANIELAFSDVHQKYERTKSLLEGFKSNEEMLSLSLQTSEKTCKQHEERYESLKAHAKAQIEKSNKEILTLRDKYEMDMNKYKAIIKRLEIKCSSLEVSLQQKAEECAALSALCDEVTGKRV